jgi:hypothetical protein
MDFDTALANLGLGGTLLIFMWRAAVWMAPRAEKFLDSHITFVNAIKECQIKQTEMINDVYRIVSTSDFCRVGKCDECKKLEYKPEPGNRSGEIKN